MQYLRSFGTQGTQEGAGCASGREDPPVSDSLQGTAVAAGQPERPVSEDVGAVGNTQDQQVPTGRLQQGLQPCLKAAPEDDRRGQRVVSGGHFLIREVFPLNSWTVAQEQPPTQPPTAGLTGYSGRTLPCSPSFPAVVASGSVT